MGDDEKYTNEIVDELINYEVDEDLTLLNQCKNLSLVQIQI